MDELLHELVGVWTVGARTWGDGASGGLEVFEDVGFVDVRVGDGFAVVSVTIKYPLEGLAVLVAVEKELAFGGPFRGPLAVSDEVVGIGGTGAVVSVRTGVVIVAEFEVVTPVFNKGERIPCWDVSCMGVWTCLSVVVLAGGLPVGCDPREEHCDVGGG